MDAVFESILEVLQSCCVTTIRDLARYAVEVDVEQTAAFRLHIQALADALDGEVNPARLSGVFSCVRSELRDYQSRAEKSVHALRQDLAAKTEALDEVIHAMTSVDADHEERIRDGLHKVRLLGTSPPLAKDGASLIAASNQIADALDELQRQNHLGMGQYMAEIKSLHRRIVALEVCTRTDVSGVASRLEMETRIAAAIESDSKVSLLIFKIRNLPMVHRQFGPGIRFEAVDAFAKRFIGALPGDAVAGRWDEDQFVAMVAMDGTEAIQLAGNVERRVSGVYAFMEDGNQRRPNLVVSARVVASTPGSSYEELIDRL